MGCGCARKRKAVGSRKASNSKNRVKRKGLPIVSIRRKKKIVAKKKKK